MSTLLTSSALPAKYVCVVDIVFILDISNRDM